MFGLPAAAHPYDTSMARPTCPGCRERDAVIAGLQGQLAALAARVRDLEQRLGQNSSNSSRPPSADPPAAPKPVVKIPSGRKPGGQPGHAAHLRRRLPPERLAEVVAFRPRHGRLCAAALPESPQAGDPEPTWHQVAELPALAARVTEYQGHARTCPRCGAVTHAAIPAAVRAHAAGPRLAAVLGYLAGAHRLSKRGLEEVAEAVFAAPLALGTVSRLEGQLGAALAAPHAEALAAVRAAAVKNVDETGWKQAGRRRWLWLAATATAAAFLVHTRRNWSALTALLGETVTGVVGSDRWGTYNRLPVGQRQVCWAHLKRDFRKCVDRGGVAAQVGEGGLLAVREVFRLWHLFRGGGLSRAALVARPGPVADALHELLEAGRGCADGKAATFCGNVLAVAPALWRFAVTEGVEPTNNHAERLLRQGVLWRRTSFGCHSEGGCRFAERLLTVVQTLRLQGRSVLEYLGQAITAHRGGLTGPKLIAAG
jgi:transposase